MLELQLWLCGGFSGCVAWEYITVPITELALRVGQIRQFIINTLLSFNAYILHYSRTEYVLLEHLLASIMHSSDWLDKQ